MLFRFIAFPVTLCIGVAAALICEWLHTPLPWMIGPLFATACARVFGARLYTPRWVRDLGQSVIGTSLGLYFTPVILAAVASYAGFMALGVVFALLLGAVCAWLLHRMTGVDRTTSFFAMSVGGASEMAAQAERYGADVSRVAAAHSLRVLLVVAIIPFGFQFSGVHGLDPYVPATKEIHLVGLAVLLAATACGALALRALNLPNATFIGALAVAMLLTGSGVVLSALPSWLIYLGQLFVGVSLGVRFTPEFLKTAPRFVAAVTACSVVAMLLAFGFAYVLSLLSGIHFATAILATSPGGVAEMSLTASTLKLGVPVVTAFHVMRVIALVVAIGPIFRCLHRLRQARQSKG